MEKQLIFFYTLSFLVNLILGLCLFKSNKDKSLYHACLAKMIRSEVKHIGYEVMPGVSDHELIIEYFAARIGSREKGDRVH